MHVYGIIPARLESHRLPRKLLLRSTGMTLLEHTWRMVREATCFDEVLIATDSSEIAEEARRFSAVVEMTGEHVCGTDRVAECVRNRLPDAEIVVNIQGDEPLLEPGLLDHLVSTLRANPATSIATLAVPIRDEAAWQDASCVKVVRAADGHALYFSRASVPCRHPDDVGTMPFGLAHVGIYALRRDALEWFGRTNPFALEKVERLEQLRFLEAGHRIHVEVVQTDAFSIDTMADYQRFVEQVRGRR